MVTVGRERFDVVCTDTSATGAFFTTRNPPPVGTEVTVELRAGAVDSPIVVLTAIVTRTSQLGVSGPIGFGVSWRAAECDAGPEPLFRVLRQVLHLATVGDADLTRGRAAEYLFAPVAESAPVEPQRGATPDGMPTSPIARPSSMRQVQGVWSPPLHRATGNMPRASTVVARDGQATDASRQSAQHPMELEPQAPVAPLRGLGGRTGASAVLAAAPSGMQPAYDNQPVRQADKSVLFGGLRERSSMAVGHGQDVSAPPSDDASQSWPVYALAPGERRAVTDSEAVVAHTVGPSRPPQAPTARRASGVVATDSLSPRPPRSDPAISKHAAVAPSYQPTSQSFHLGPEKTEAVTPARPAARKPEGAGMLVAADVPISYVRQNQFVPGQLTGIAEQLACVVTAGDPPGLDELLVIYLPVRVDGVWRTVQLAGKLLQVATDVPAGKRFVMHIERADEGRHKGAFRSFLQALHGQ